MTAEATTQAPIGPVDLAAEREAVGPIFEEKMIECLRSGAYVLGPEVKAFEAEFAAYQRTAHALGVASGTDALILGLRALGDVGEAHAEVVGPDQRRGDGHDARRDARGEGAAGPGHRRGGPGRGCPTGLTKGSGR